MVRKPTQAHTQTRNIGIVACSAEGAALCYRTICAEASKLLGEHAHPEISMHSISLAEYVTYINANDWRGVGELMLVSANKLKSVGAELLICPDNTIHQAMSYVIEPSPLPWLHIAEVVASEAKKSGYQKIGLTGTQWLVESDVYPEKLAHKGIEFVRPDETERKEIGRIIMEELVYGVFNNESIAYFQKVIDGLKDQQCDAVVLGCTEIPLIINDKNSSLPTLNSTRLLALAALEYALK